jgi:chromosome segregation ATPase
MASEWKTSTPGGTGGPHAAAQATAGLHPPRAVVAHAEAGLRAQRAELVRMMADLRKMQQALREQQGPDLEALRRENGELREALACREGSPGEVGRELERLRAEAESLRQLVRQKDELLEELRERGSPAEGPGLSDPDSYEAELTQFRRQLEQDRRHLDQLREQLRVRAQELDAATREMEMEMSRERAELARERTRLVRLRDEVRGELERFQRGAGVWGHLAPVQRLRAQLFDGGSGTVES